MYILPFLFTTLHPGHIVLTEARTFMPLLKTRDAEVFCTGRWECAWAWVCGMGAARSLVNSGRVELSSARNMVVVVYTRATLSRLCVVAKSAGGMTLGETTARGWKGEL